MFLTNICSRNANLENIYALISNLEFSFSVIAVSQKWTPKGRNEVNPRKLEAYQNYHGIRGSSIKSGCSFYVKKGIKLKPIQFFLCNFCKRKNYPQKLSDFYFYPFFHTGVKFQVRTQWQSKIIELEPRYPSKNSCSGQILIKLRL